MAHEKQFSEKLSYTDESVMKQNCIGSKLPKTQNDWL